MMRIAFLRSKQIHVLVFIIGWSATLFAQPQLVCTPAEVQGRVLDAKGRPIANAQLFVQNQPYSQDIEWFASQPEENGLLGTATSDTNGYFKINWEVTQVSALANTSCSASLIALAPGRALDYQHFTMWRPQYIEFKLESESEHVGQVVDDQGQPLADAQVLVDAIHADTTTVHRGMTFNSEGLLCLMHSTLRPRTTTDANGVYTLKGLPKGQVVLIQVTHPKFPAIRRFQPIDENSPQQIEAGQANNRFSEWRASYGQPMALASARIREVVAVDRSSGDIVPGVKVCRFFDGAFSQAEPNGRLAIWLDEQGRYYAQRSGETQWSNAFFKETAGNSNELEIASPKTLFGQVIDAEDGKGIEGVAVYAGRPGSPGFSLAYTDESGKYSMTTYQSLPIVTLSGPRLKYRLPVSKISTSEIEPSTALEPELHTRRVQFASGQNSAAANFSLPRYPAIRIKVLDDDASPTANAKVSMTAASNYFPVTYMATSDQHGVAEFYIDRPITKSYVWAASEKGFAVEELNSIPPDVVTLKLAPTIRIDGHISALDQEGNLQVVSGLPVFMLSADRRAGLELATTNEAGEFSVYLPPEKGEHVILYVDFHSNRQEIQVELEEGARAYFDLKTP